MRKVQTIDEYIREYPESVQKILTHIRRTVSQAAPQATEAISYGIPTFKLHGNLVHFGAYKHHIGFYPGPEAMEVFKKELSDYELSKGTVQFPLDQEIPYHLITKITEFRVKKTLESRK